MRYMRYTLAGLLLLVTCSAGAMMAAQRTDSAPEAEQAIRELEARFVQASLAGDLPTLERLWAADYQFTAPNGLVIPRDAYLAMLKAKSVAYEHLELEGLQVRVYGDAATATGRLVVKGRAMDHVLDGVDHYLTVYVNRDGTWQQVAMHALRIPGTTRSSGPA
jgi:ketosteroid isomerase-like protein